VACVAKLLTLQHFRSAHQVRGEGFRLLFGGDVWAQRAADGQRRLEDQIVFIDLHFIARCTSVQAATSSNRVVLAVAGELQVDLRQVRIGAKAERTRANAIAVCQVCRLVAVVSEKLAIVGVVEWNRVER
jgi:hypothetical protein